MMAVVNKKIRLAISRKMVRCGNFANGDCCHGEGWWWSQNVGLNKDKLCGWLASLALENAPKAAMEWKISEPNTVTSDAGGDEYG